MARATHPRPAVGLEGLVSKRRDRAYRAGRCPHWVKIKNPNSSAMRRASEIDWRCLWGFLRAEPDVPTHLRELVRQFGRDGYSALPPQDFSTRLQARIARLRAGLDHRNRR